MRSTTCLGAVFCALGLWLPATSLEAQIRPGIERGDYWGDVRARYRNEVLTDVGEVLEEWQTAWGSDDVERFLATYSEDAIVLLDDHPERSLPEVRAALTALLDRSGPIQTSLQDFEVGGELAFATLSFRYDEATDTGRRAVVSGYLVLAFVKHTGDWKIRSQILRRSND